MEKKISITSCKVISLLLTFFLLMICSANAAADSWDPHKTLLSYLKSNYPWEEIQITDLDIRGDISEKPPVKIIVEKGPLGDSVFSLIFDDNSKSAIRANVRAFGNIVKSKRSFRRGHILSEGDIYIEKMDIRKMPHSTIKNLQKIVGKPLRRSIAANMPIVEGMVDRAQPVKRGKLVALVLEQEGLSISAAGKTKEKGYVGMPVRAVNLSSKKEVTGVLIDENTVKVEL